MNLIKILKCFKEILNEEKDRLNKGKEENNGTTK